jgi:hypothetical protein
MSIRVCCYTLFDITQTGVMNRSKPNEDDIENWVHRRNTQCNFDTILQVISLRSQPEVMREPTMVVMTENDFEKFGFLYEPREDSPSHCWRFEFEIHHSSVFENGIVPFGALYKDCDGVPMLVCKTQTESTNAFLDSSDELKNIHFEEL